jgi:hypothetical protein
MNPARGFLPALRSGQAVTAMTPHSASRLSDIFTNPDISCRVPRRVSAFLSRLREQARAGFHFPRPRMCSYRLRSSDSGRTDAAGNGPSAKASKSAGGEDLRFLRRSGPALPADGFFGDANRAHLCGLRDRSNNGKGNLRCSIRAHGDALKVSAVAILTR